MNVSQESQIWMPIVFFLSSSYLRSVYFSGSIRSTNTWYDLYFRILHGYSRMPNKFAARWIFERNFAKTTCAHIHIISNLLRQRTKNRWNVYTLKTGGFFSLILVLATVCVCIFSVERLRQQTRTDIAIITFRITNRQHKDKKLLPDFSFVFLCMHGMFLLWRRIAEKNNNNNIEQPKFP